MKRRDVLKSGLVLAGTAAVAAPATSAPKSALELRLRSALSSAQVLTSLRTKSERMSIGRTREPAED